MSLLKKYQEQFILAGILLLAAILRFYRYADWSLSNDELSAVTRLNFADLHELVKEGIRPDYHPAGVQVFLFYWIKIFGNAVWSVRLPFVLCGIGSVYFTYLIAKKWFSVQTAQFTALALACLTYPILYSQLARPYAPGLLFSLMMVYFWSKLLFEEGHSKKIMLAYTLSTIFCMYTHYFSFMFAAIVGITGLFFMSASNFKDYLLAGILSILAFLPHWGISAEQLSRGGIGSWLGKPDGHFFTDYLHYACNDSGIVLVIAFAVIFVSVVPGLFEKHENRFRIISLSWFMLPFFIGYFYSIHINPVLQYSVLLFSFPFLLMFFFSYIKINSQPVSVTLLSTFALLITWTGVNGQKFYSQKPFSSFKELVENEVKWSAKYGENNVCTIYNVISPSYLEYYSPKEKSKRKTALPYYFRGDDPTAFYNISQKVVENKTNYFIYGWSNCPCPPEIYEIIKMNYPLIIEDHIYFNSRITLFSKASANYRKPLFYSSLDPTGKPKSGWNFDTSKIDSSNGRKTVLVDTTMEFAGGYEGKLSDLYADTLKYINIQADISLMKETACHLVIEFHKEANDSLYGWFAVSNKNKLYSSNEKWESLLLTQKIPSEYRKGDKIKVYVWNPEKKPMWIGNISISSFADMNYEPIYELK